MSERIGRGKVVTLAYQLHLDSGEAIDAADATDPFEYIHGQGHIIPGLEKALEGMQPGETREVTVAPADAYGEFLEEEVHQVARKTFPDDLQLQEGMILAMRDPDTEGVIQARVLSFDDNTVELDLNHELAGETLVFEVEVIGVREATASELAHGHVHNGEDH